MKYLEAKERMIHAARRAKDTVHRVATDPRTQRVAQVAKNYLVEVAHETGRRLDAAPPPPAAETGKDAVRRIAGVAFESAQAVNKARLTAIATPARTK